MALNDRGGSFGADPLIDLKVAHSVERGKE